MGATTGSSAPRSSVGTKTSLLVRSDHPMRGAAIAASPAPAALSRSRLRMRTSPVFCTLATAALRPANARKDCEAAGQRVEQIFAIGGKLPVFAHRNVGHVLPQLHLKLDTDPPLLVEGAGLQPGGPQGFDVWASRPAVEGRQPVCPDHGIAVRVGVRERSVDKPKKCVPAALVRRRLILPLAGRGGLFHLLQVHIHAGAAQLVGPGEPKRTDRLDIGWGDDNDRFAVITGTGQ